jgi:AraC-like DNA-binding protein
MAVRSATCAGSRIGHRGTPQPKTEQNSPRTAVPYARNVDPLRDEMVAAAPHPALRPYVSRYTGYRHHTGPGVHRGLPSRTLTIVLTLEGTVDFAAGQGLPRSLAALAGGLHCRPVMMEHDGHQFGIQTGFTPLGARALLGLPAGALGGAVVDLGALLGSTAGELADRIRSATTWADRFAHLDAVLTRIAVPAAIACPELDWAWQRLTSSGSVAVGTVAAEVGWSRQHLRAMFRREFGLSPKQVARVRRFEAAHALLVAVRRPGLAEIAARCGYADQAHLARDWRDLAGTSPSVWMAEELPFVQDTGAPGGPS